MARHRALPEGVTPAQVRGALTAVIRRTMEAPGTFDANGWLRIGFCRASARHRRELHLDRQPVSVRVGLLPLGLPASDEFWSSAAQPWTAVKAWSGQTFPIDHALAT